MIAGVLPAVGRDLGISVDTAGLLVAVFSLTYGVGAPFLSAFTSNIPRRNLLLSALLFFCLVNVMSALAPNFAILLFTRVLAGCGAALYSPTAYTVATTLAPPQKRGRALAIVIAGLTISTVVGVPLGTWIGQNLGWRTTFGLVALLAGIAVTILFLVGLPQIPASAVISLRARLAPIAQPPVLMALLPTLLWSVATFTVYTYITPFLQQITHVQTVDGLLLIYGLGAVIGSWGGGYSVDRFGPIRPICVALIVLIVSLSILPITAVTFVGAAVTMFIWSLAGWSIFPSQQHRLLTLFPASANVILALNNSALYLGSAVGATVGGFVLSNIGVAALAVVGGSFAALALLMIIITTRTAVIPNPQAQIVATEITEGLG